MTYNKKEAQLVSGAAYIIKLTEVPNPRRHIPFLIRYNLDENNRDFTCEIYTIHSEKTVITYLKSIQVSPVAEKAPWNHIFFYKNRLNIISDQRSIKEMKYYLQFVELK